MKPWHNFNIKEVFLFGLKVGLNKIVEILWYNTVNISYKYHIDIRVVSGWSGCGITKSSVLPMDNVC